MVSVHATSAVYRGFGPRSGQTKGNTIGICCFSAKHAALRRKSKDWLARNPNNVTFCTFMTYTIWGDCCLTPIQQFFSYIILDFYSASSLKQQSAGKHVAPLPESRANMGRGMITRPIWKCPCIKLFITYFRHLE
jgi:hypothetical protein